MLCVKYHLKELNEFYFITMAKQNLSFKTKQFSCLHVQASLCHKIASLILSVSVYLLTHPPHPLTGFLYVFQIWKSLLGNFYCRNIYLLASELLFTFKSLGNLHPQVRISTRKSQLLYLLISFCLLSQ